jgi:hypothetical protein
MVPEGVYVAMNDRDEVLVRYLRPPLAHEYDVNVARWAWTEAWTRSFIAAPTPVGQIDDLFYPAAASEPQVPVIFESTPLAVEVFGVWSPQNGLHELSTVVDVASDGRWPRWTNGSKLFTIDAKWIDNQGNVYGDSRVCLLRGWGSDGILGADMFAQASGPDGNADSWTPWKYQWRWKKGAGINVWVASPDGAAGGFAQAIQPSGVGIGVPNNRWFESVSSSGQVLVASWNDATNSYKYELNGVRIHIDSRGAQVSNPMPFDGNAVIYVPEASDGETILIQHNGTWHPKLVGTRKACWGRWGSLTYRIQGNQRILPKDWWADSWLITDSGLALGVALKLNPDGSEKEGEQAVTALLVPVTPTASEAYMLSGHEGDVLHLSAGAGSDLQCEWRLKDTSGAQGVFAKPGGQDWGAKIEACEAVFRAGTSGNPNISGHARAQSPGKNILQLRISGLLVLEEPIEVLEIKPRSAWWARPPNLKSMEGMSELRGITVHHSSSDMFSGVFEVNRIQIEHMGLLWHRFSHQRWADIAYHFLLDSKNPDPLAPLDLYEGRQIEGLGLKEGPFTKGSAVLLKNTDAGLNLCVLGKYSEKKQQFSELHSKRLEKALTALCRRYKLSDNVLHTHRGLSEWYPQVEVTECPGWQVLLKLLPEGMRAAIRENLQ